MYEAVLSYQDMVQNAAAEVVVAGIEHDLTTQSPSFIVPPSSATIRIKVAFLLSLDLPEDATEDSLQLAHRPDRIQVATRTARARSRSAREVSGEYNVTMEALSTAADNVAGISDIDIKVDLVHLQTYIFRIQYQDVLRNAPATDFTGTMTFDVVTATPTIHYPVADGHRSEKGSPWTLPYPKRRRPAPCSLPSRRAAGLRPGGDHHATSADQAGARTPRLNDVGAPADIRRRPPLYDYHARSRIGGYPLVPK